METQLHHLHRVKVLVLPHLVRSLWYPRGSALGLPVCVHFLLPHLGCGSLHQELSDWVAVHQPHLLSLHPDLLRSLLWSPGQDLQQRTRCTAQRSLRTHTAVVIVWLAEAPYVFLHHKIGPGILLAPLILLLSSHAAPLPPTRELTCPVGLLPPEAQWQLQHGSVTGLALLEGSVLLTEGERGPPAMIWGSVHPHLSLNRAFHKRNGLPNTAAPPDKAACIHYIRPFLNVVDAVCVLLFNLTEVIFTEYVTLKKSSKKKKRLEICSISWRLVLVLYSVCMLLIFPVLGRD